MLDHTLFVFSVERDHVEKKFYKPVKEFIKTLDRLGPLAVQNAAITFDGYEDDPRELSEIDEVRAYIRRLFNDHPHLFLYMSFQMEIPQYMIPCLGDFYSIYKGEKLTKEQIIRMHLENKEVPQIEYHVHIPEANVRRMQQATAKRAAKYGMDELAAEITKWMDPFKQPLDRRR